MILVVVVFNVLISLLCLYVAWQVWNLRRVLGTAADAINIAERNTYAVLHDAPRAISQGQIGTRALRERYQELEVQLQRVEQVLVILGFVQRVWRSQRLRRPQRYRRRR